MTYLNNDYTFDYMCLQHIEEVANIHISSFNETSIGVLLGKDFLQAKNKWFVNKNYSISLVAKTKGKVIGYVYGAPLNYEKQMHMDVFIDVIKSIIRNPNIFLSLKLYIEVISKVKKLLVKNKKLKVNIPRPVAVLAVIAVDNDHRCKGVGSLLLECFEREAKKNGFNSVLLKSRINNKKANYIYHKNKWVLLDKKPLDEMFYYYKIL